MCSINRTAKPTLVLVVSGPCFSSAYAHSKRQTVVDDVKLCAVRVSLSTPSPFSCVIINQSNGQTEASVVHDRQWMRKFVCNSRVHWREIIAVRSYNYRIKKRHGSHTFESTVVVYNSSNRCDNPILAADEVWRPEPWIITNGSDGGCCHRPENIGWLIAKQS